MAFPSLFPTGHAVHGQPQQKNIRIDQYALHLMRYHDNRFGSHPRFRYFLYNLIMRHHSQSSASMFVKQSQENNIPTTIEALRSHLQTLPANKLPEHVMRFGAHLRGTRAHWNSRRRELTEMITQLGCPTLFFTLSATDTKWPDLHVVMGTSPPSNPLLRQQWRTCNVIQ
jgi:hypothetical protein